MGSQMTDWESWRISFGLVRGNGGGFVCFAFDDEAEGLRENEGLVADEEDEEARDTGLDDDDAVSGLEGWRGGGAIDAGTETGGGCSRLLRGSRLSAV